MTALLELFWPAMAIALGLGLVIGIATRSPAPPSRTVWTATALVVLAGLAALAVAVLEALPGRAGLWLETGLLILGPYGLGCAVGSPIGRAWRRDKVTPAS